MKARAADADGRGIVASQGYALALAAAPEAAAVAFHAYRQGLESGDLDLVRTAIASMDEAGTAPADVAIFQYADALRREDAAAADAALTRLADGQLGFLAPALRGWLAFERGGEPFAALDAAADEAIARRYAAEARVLLLIAARHHDEAMAALAVHEDGAIDLGTRVAAARLFAATGKRSMAAQLLPGDDRAVRKLREFARDGVDPGAAFGTARLYARLLRDLPGESTLPLAIVLGRSAAMLAPDDPSITIELALRLARAGATDRALAMLREITDNAAFAGRARRAELQLLSEAGRTDEAIAIAGQISGEPDASAATAQMLGDMLTLAGRDEAAAAAYATAIDRAGEAAGWTLYLQRGSALERAGRWAEARPLLERAVELAPDQPLALNALGYAQAERGEDLGEATALLARAAELAPDNAAITDSLGWVHYMSGDYAQALPLLQRAVRAEPADPEINEHLGDALWQLGRRYEARYAWRAAKLYAEPNDAERIAAKIASGLTAIARN